MKFEENKFYRHVNDATTLCFVVLNNISRDLKHSKIEVTWFSRFTGMFWGRSFGLPKIMEIPIEDYSNWKEFKPSWIK